MTPFEAAQDDPAWIDWYTRLTQALITFLSQDVPGMVQDPWSKTSMYRAELAAHGDLGLADLATPDRAEKADRWDRYALQAIRNHVARSVWVNRPAAPGEQPGLRPAILTPWGEYITSPLAAVLAEPPGSPRRGLVLLGMIEQLQQAHAEWVTAGAVCAEDFLRMMPRVWS